MKILFWNIGYARGMDGSMTDYVIKGNRIFFATKRVQTKILDEIVKLVDLESPDLFLYTEVLLGSERNQYLNQHEYISKKLQYGLNGALGKYGDGFFEKLPLHKGNANGYCAKRDVEEEYFYTKHGSKKLVYKIYIDGVTAFMLHLSLISRVRELQLQELAGQVNNTTGPVVVCGDMNIMSGTTELGKFQKITNLVIRNNPPLTFPSFAPLKTVDLFLFRGFENNRIPKTYTIKSVVSDHLPVVFEV